jgi:hypothetical protein
MKRGITPYDVVGSSAEPTPKKQRIIVHDSRDTEEDKYFADEDVPVIQFLLKSLFRKLYLIYIQNLFLFLLKKEKRVSSSENNTSKNDSTEIDPLDAFMMGIQQQLITQSTQHSEGPKVFYWGVAFFVFYYYYHHFYVVIDFVFHILCVVCSINETILNKKTPLKVS